MALSTIETQKLIASDKKDFGSSVAIDGNYVIIGASRDDDKGEDSGAIYIFKNDGYGSFIELDKIQASGVQYRDYFGESVSISGDYIIIGATGDDTQGSSAGAVYIFKNNGNDQFIQIDKITAIDGISGYRFGSEVAISGAYAVIAAPGNQSAYIFKNDGNDNFNQIDKLVVHNNFGDHVGICGDYVIVSSPENSVPPMSAYVFKNNGNDHFIQIAELEGSTSYSDRYGSSVAINENYAMVGAHGDDEDYGSVWLYQNDGADHFTKIDILTPSKCTPGDRFGCSVAIYDNYIVVGSLKYGSIEYYGDMKDTGAAFIFKKDGYGNFAEIAKFVASDLAFGDTFGKHVTIGNNYAVTVGKGKYVYLYNVKDTILPIKSYKIQSFSARNSNVLKAIITLCNLEDKEIGQIKFYNDQTNLPANDTVSSSDLIECHYLADQYTEIVDLLRYEKPIFLHFNTTTNMGHISTKCEPIGELESYPKQFLRWEHLPIQIS